MNLKPILAKAVPPKVKNLFSIIWLGIKKNKMAFLQLIGMLFIFLAVINIIFFFLSKSSSVCNVCHYMNEHYALWQKSAHKNIACVECHPSRRLLTGAYLFKYIAGDYNPRPRANVESEICVNCHSEKLQPTKTAFKKDISFDHGAHLGDLKRGKKLRCTSCHARGMANEHFYVDQNVCYTCHFKGAERGHAVTGCKVCHGVPKKLVSHEGFQFDHSSYTKIGVDCSQCHLDVISGNANVDQKKCYSCHMERLSEFSNSQKIHEVHISKKGIDCDECHNQLTHGKIKMVSPLEASCENCHKSLHSPQRQMYIGIDGKRVKDTPSRMFAAQVSCEGCHIDLNGDGKSDLSEKRQSCIKCHDKNYGVMLDRWIKTLDESKRSIAPIFTHLSSLKNNKSINGEEKSMIDDILTNYNLFDQGNGVHNIDYAFKLLKYIVNGYDTLNMKYFKSNIKASRTKFISDEKEYCSLCHSVIPQKEITKFNNKDFPHQLHKTFLNCSKCHSFDTHKKIVIDEEGCNSCHSALSGDQKNKKFGEIDFPHSKHSKDNKIECSKCHLSNDFKKGGIKKSACTDCHHQGKYQILDCKKCHSVQASIYNGSLVTTKDQKDVMKGGGIECDACHISDSKVVRPKKEICSQCHEKSYEGMMDDWQKDVKELIKNIEDLAKQKKKGTDPVLSKVKTDGSFGIHNYMMISDELNKLKSKLESSK